MISEQELIDILETVSDTFSEFKPLVSEIGSIGIFSTDENKQNVMTYYNDGGLLDKNNALFGIERHTAEWEHNGVHWLNVPYDSNPTNQSLTVETISKLEKIARIIGGVNQHYLVQVQLSDNFAIVEFWARTQEDFDAVIPLLQKVLSNLTQEDTHIKYMKSCKAQYGSMPIKIEIFKR